MKYEDYRRVWDGIQSEAEEAIQREPDLVDRAFTEFLESKANSFPEEAIEPKWKHVDITCSMYIRHLRNILVSIVDFLSSIQAESLGGGSSQLIKNAFHFRNKIQLWLRAAISIYGDDDYGDEDPVDSPSPPSDSWSVLSPTGTVLAQ